MTPLDCGSQVRKLVRISPVLVGVGVLAATLALPGLTPSRAEGEPRLNAAVGPGFTISFTNPDGSVVSSIGAGTYNVAVTDADSNHNFHLYGPGVDRATAIDGTGSTNWVVTFTDRTVYAFHCDRHPASLNGQFNIGNVPAGTPAPLPPGSGIQATAARPVPPTILLLPGISLGPLPPPAEPLPARGTLRGSVDQNGALELTRKGTSVTTLREGSYRLLVSDRDQRQGFSLRAIGYVAQVLTGRSFVGTKAVTVALTKGQWKIYSPSREAATSRFFYVTA